MHFNGHDWTNYTTADGLASNGVSAIAIEDDGSVWFGSFQAGVSHFDGQNWTIYTSQDGLSDDTINDIEVTIDGIVWFGSSHGANSFDGSIMAKYPGCIPNVRVYLTSASDGSLWFGTKYAIAKMKVSDGQLIECTNFTPEGVGDINVSELVATTDGNIWVGTSLYGILRYVP